MKVFFAGLMLLVMAACGYFFVKMIIAFIKDGKEAGYSGLKKFGIAFGVFIVSSAIFSQTLTPEELNPKHKNAEVAQTTNPEEPARPPQEAFNQWNTEVQEKLKYVDNNWELLWQGTITFMNEKSMDRFAAYKNIDNLETILDATRENFDKIRVPKELTKEQQDLLIKADGEYQNFIRGRSRACGKLKDCLDSGKMSPSQIKEITDTVNRSDSHAVKAAGYVNEVATQLNSAQ